MDTVEDEDPQAAITRAVEVQSTNAGDHPTSVLAHGARLPLADGDTDTLVLYLADHVNRRRLVLGLPYRPAPNFAVLTVQVLHTDDVAERELEGLIDVFFTGVEEHPYGQRIWTDHFQDS
jgi:hypothetical protein